ncbi:DUF885 family protein [Actinomadura macra]|uniref:DUF885 family protein n=1 Tax=Actinomadura macra TaxID=46164 RepID=UPI00082A03CC|nr:DUF885 family protein [Actinomadura macra]
MGGTRTDGRLWAICDLRMPAAREEAGRHEYDGIVQDLSPGGVKRALGALGGERYTDPHDEAHAAAAEEALRVTFGELELHRANPMWHIQNLDLACYDRAYASEERRREARLAHLRAWPEAVEAAVRALDHVPAPLAVATLPAARGLGRLLPEGEEAARKAHARFVAIVESWAEHGDPSAALGGAALARLVSSAEAQEIDLTDLAMLAEAERGRVRALLDEACRRVDPDATSAETMRALLADHPDAGHLVAEARAVTAEVVAWTAERGLVPYTDGECLVGEVPPSQPGQVATMTVAAPYEPDGPSWFRVNPPAPSASERDRKDWLSIFSRTTLPNIAIHEVAPGHFSHGRAKRRAATDVRRTLHSEGFTEGWAHYCEELAVEEGFRQGDPRHAAGVYRDALWRVTRLACVIGLHTGAMDLAEAEHRFSADAFLDGPAARTAARRGLTDPLSGFSYTTGKLAIRGLRDRARAAWGPRFTLPRFHAALLDLGAPPLGLLDTALERG